MPQTAHLNVLSALGWKINYTVGISDDVTIHSGISCSAVPNQTIDIGVVSTYCISAPTVSLNYPAGQWTLYAYADDGAISVAAQTGLMIWNLNLSSLPSGHNWQRDLDGRVIGVLKYSGADMSGNRHSDLISVGINYQPQNLEVRLTNSSSSSCDCDNATVHFFAPGSSSYTISKRTQFFSGTWSAWSAPITIPEGVSTYTFPHLLQYDNYQFQVSAINASGTITSGIFQRDRCKNYVVAAPNPIYLSNSTFMRIFINPNTQESLAYTCCDADCGADIGVANDILGFDDITSAIEARQSNPCGPFDPTATTITLTNATFPQLQYTFDVSKTDPTDLQIDIANVVPGIYALAAYNDKLLIGRLQVEIDQ